MTEPVKHPKTYALWVDVTLQNEDVLVPLLSAQLPKDVAYRVAQEGGLVIGEPSVHVETLTVRDENGDYHDVRRVTCRARYLTADQMPRVIRENWDIEETTND